MSIKEKSVLKTTAEYRQRMRFALPFLEPEGAGDDVRKLLDDIDTLTAEVKRLEEINLELVNTHNTHVILGARAEDEIKTLTAALDEATRMLTCGHHHSLEREINGEKYCELCYRFDCCMEVLGEEQP